MKAVQQWIAVREDGGSWRVRTAPRNGDDTGGWDLVADGLTEDVAKRLARVPLMEAALNTILPHIIQAEVYSEVARKNVIQVREALGGKP